MLSYMKSSTSKDDFNANRISNVGDDTISDISIGDNMVATGSWDGSVRIYKKMGLNLSPFVLYENLGAPVTCVLLINDAICVAGLVDGNLVIMNDFNNVNSKQVKKVHENIIKKICFFNNQFIITASFDGFYKVFDSTFNEVHSQNVNAKIYCMDCSNGHLALGLSDKKVVYVDLNNNIVQNFNTKAEYAIRSISILSTQYGCEIAVGTVEGKIEILNTKDVNNSVVLRLHRADDKLYSINQTEILSQKSVITAGSDGALYLNDKSTRFKVATSKYDKPITAMATKGKELIFALGDDWSKGFQPQSIRTELLIADLSRFNIN